MMCRGLRFAVFCQNTVRLQKTFELTVSQHSPQNTDPKKFKPYFFPLKAALLDSKGKETDLGVLVISKLSQTFSL